MGLVLVHYGEDFKMKEVSIRIDESLLTFYKKVGERADSIPAEQVMADALFKLAGELALNALHKKNER